MGCGLKFRGLGSSLVVRKCSALRYVHLMGWEVPFNIPLMEGMFCFMGWVRSRWTYRVLYCSSKVWVKLDWTVMVWMQLDGFGCPDALEYSFIEFWRDCLQRSLVPVPQVFTLCTMSWLVHTFYLRLFCQVRWSSNTQNPGEGCTIIAKNNS